MYDQDIVMLQVWSSWTKYITMHDVLHVCVLHSIVWLLVHSCHNRPQCVRLCAHLQVSFREMAQEVTVFQLKGKVVDNA